MGEYIFWALAILWMVSAFRFLVLLDKTFENIADIAKQNRYQSEMLKYIADLIYREVTTEDDEQVEGEVVP